MRKNNNFLEILIFCLCSTTLTLALRFDINDPITVDTDVILVGKPAILKCNYMKFRTENVREITWYIAYDGFKSKVSNRQSSPQRARKLKKSPGKKLVKSNKSKRIFFREIAF